MTFLKELIKPEMVKLNIELSEKQYSQIYKYYNLLIEWNHVMNLTAITDETEFVTKHFVDSILLVEHYDFNSCDSLIDIGTGAGFPGIPLKIVFPHLKVTLLDSLNKRIHFLNEVIILLELENAETIHGRAEDYGKDDVYREQYDLCVSRAVSQLPVLSEYCMPFVKVQGSFIAYKSIDTDDEIANSYSAIEILGGSEPKIKESTLIENKVVRRFVFIEKKEITPIKYPRKAGIPQKRPLK